MKHLKKAEKYINRNVVIITKTGSIVRTNHTRPNRVPLYGHSNEDWRSISCMRDRHFYIWTFPTAVASTSGKNRPIRDEEWKHLKSLSTILKYSDIQLLVEVSARKTYLLVYRYWILWRKDLNGNRNSIRNCQIIFFMSVCLITNYRS